MICEITCDNFAGGGGASCGIEMALGRSVDEACNHSPEALCMHMANHPGARHHRANLVKVDPRDVALGRPIGLAWFSPDCTHHSKAKGGKPKEKKIRDLAWVVNHWAWIVKPRVICVENVWEILGWGPLDKDGQPIPECRGQYFEDWIKDLRAAGYKVEYRELAACDYGVPTVRSRFFLIARRDGRPIIWPEATHGPGRLPYRQAAEIIDWSIPTRSVFDPTRPKEIVPATMARIAKGIERFVIDCPEPFLIKYHGGDARTHSLNEPLRTQDTSNRFGLVVPFFAPRYGEREGQEPRCQPVTAPLATVVPTGNGAQLVACYLAQHNRGAVGHSMNEPVSTLTGTCSQQQLVTAFLIKYYRTGTAVPLTSPLDTITTDDRFGLVTVHGEPWRIVDIGMRMLSPRELFRAQGFPDSYIIDPLFHGKRGLKPLSKSAQVRCCGNSVCPPLVAAVVRANVKLRNAGKRPGRKIWMPLFEEAAC